MRDTEGVAFQHENTIKMNHLSHLQKTLRGLCLCLLCFLTQQTQAQKADKIYMTDGSNVSVKVMSTKGDSVFYRAYFASFQKTLFGVPKTGIEKIVYQDDALEYYGGKVVNYAPRDKKRRTDMIYRKDGSELSVSIVSTEGDSIRYRAYYNNINTFIFSAPKSEVDRIYYKNGLVEDISPQSAENTRIVTEQIHIIEAQKKHIRDSIQIQLDKHKNIIKLSPFTFVKNYLVVGYERSIGKQQSAELKVGIIGMSPEKYELPAKGVFGSISYKFIIKPAELPKRPRNLLHGAYFRPEVAFGAYNQIYKHETFRGSDKPSDIQEEKHHVSYRCLGLNMGKQWIRDGFVLDFFMGGGIGAYEQSASSFGIVRASRFGYRMNMPAIKGTSNVKFKIGLYIGYNF